MQHTSNFGFCLFRTKRHKIGTMHESSYYSIKKVHEMSQYQPHDRPPFPPLLPFLFTVLSAKLPSHSHVHLLLLLLLLRPWHITLASPAASQHVYIIVKTRIRTNESVQRTSDFKASASCDDVDVNNAAHLVCSNYGK